MNRFTIKSRTSTPRRMAVMGCIVLLAGTGLICSLFGQTTILKRNRGETYYNCLTSNTEGHGNIWLSIGGVGHVWDDSPRQLSSSAPKQSGFWISNARAFPEVRASIGLYEFAMVTLETRPITWAAKIPGWVACDAKLTWPNNKNLRFFGFGLDGKLQYNLTNGPPTLGGYVGFMPEGYVAKGGVFEGKALFDVDCISTFTFLPLRAIVNLGIRLPLDPLFADHFQYLGSAGVVFAGYDYEFFATYSIEAFDNFSGPRTFRNPDNTKRFLVWFKENPMYLTVGGNVHYQNGFVLSIAAPLLLSTNVGSKMSAKDLTSLNTQRVDLFPYEVTRGIKDPYDPWFVKWKIAGSISIPIKFTMTSAEMMRNFLLLKNTKKQNRLDIDNRLRNLEQAPSQETIDESLDAEKRLEEIEKRKQEMEKE